MATFEDARQIVEEDVPGGAVTASYGFESDDSWFPIVLPERLGGRVPAVSKETGALAWVSSLSDEYSDSRPYSDGALSDDGVMVAAAGRADVVAVLSALRSRLSGGDVRDELDAIIADLQTLTAGYQVDLDAHLPGGHNQADHGRRRTGVLGSVLDRLGGLRSKLGGDDLAELDRAMDMLRNLESSDVDDDDLEEPDVEEDDGPTVLFESYSAGDVEMNHYTDGSITVQWGDGEGGFLFYTPQEARDVAALFEKVASAPGQPDSPMGTLVAEATTPDGKWKVARWDGGGPGSVYELGEPDDVTQDSEPYSTLGLEDTQTDEANDFARALRELAQLADEVLAARPTTAGSMFDADVSQMPAQLQAYWLTGEGAAKVKWCMEGSFRRARRLMLQEGVPARMVNGTVANLYRKACGKNPGRHTSLELDTRVFREELVDRDGQGQFADEPGGGTAETPTVAGMTAERWFVVENSVGCSSRFAVTNLDGAIGGCFDTRQQAFTHIADLQGLQDTFGPPERHTELTAPPGALWHAVVHTEGISTGKRTWLPQSVQWRPPPFALHQEVASSAHGGQPVTVYVGNTLAVARTGNAIHLWGDIDLDSTQGLEWARKLMAGYGGWPSFGPGSEAIEYDLIHGPVPGTEPQQIVFRKYRMGEVTAVSVPGQEGTYFEALPALVDALGARTAPTGQPAPIVVAGGGTHTVEIPNLPPSDWFEEPEAFPHGYAVVMEDNGHIYGLVAPDGEAHRTYAQAGERRTLGSLGKIDLTRYMRETMVEGGQRVYAGPLTMECMHAPTQGYGRLDRRNQFYQDTCSVFARVAVGMCTDGAGMWLNGAAMPGVTSDQVLKFLACGVSLDVQPHPEKRGWLELVAVLVVPSEGWAKSKQGLVSPVTRIRETEDGGVLVASVVPTVFDGPPVSPRIDSSIVFGIAADAGINPETRIAADAAKVTKMLAGR